MKERALTLDDQLCFALYAASNAVVRAYRGRLDAIGLTYPQYLVMLVLWQDGPQKMRRIAERLILPANAITPLVDRLVAAGFVRRVPDPKDRRAVWIELTEAGTALHDASSRAQQEVECTTGLNRDALVHLREELRSLVARMEGSRDAD
ncbi:MarR family winged helix-turn-helix transcriptional regulator [Litorisediminicola beolgyonensis]|uniref:MarR family winged helix-turn-helix transcriptional regulator n=1 Tax=Litorisediminicola beolgyonensis TaxID=1173614 RepID=A0ABW3ZNE7_9RHOB